MSSSVEGTLGSPVDGSQSDDDGQSSDDQKEKKQKKEKKHKKAKKQHKEKKERKDRSKERSGSREKDAAEEGDKGDKKDKKEDVPEGTDDTTKKESGEPSRQRRSSRSRSRSRDRRRYNSRSRSPPRRRGDDRYGGGYRRDDYRRDDGYRRRDYRRDDYDDYRGGRGGGGGRRDDREYYRGSGGGGRYNRGLSPATIASRKVAADKEDSSKPKKFWDGFQWVERAPVPAAAAPSASGEANVVTPAQSELLQTAMSAQARQDKRLYVGNLPPNCTPDTLTTFLNTCMGACLEGAGMTLPEGRDKAVISAWIAPTQTYGFCEFVTPECAVVAMGLSGIEFNGSALRVSRPSNFQATPTPSTALPVASAGLAGVGLGVVPAASAGTEHHALTLANQASQATALLASALGMVGPEQEASIKAVLAAQQGQMNS